MILKRWVALSFLLLMAVLAVSAASLQVKISPWLRVDERVNELYHFQIIDDIRVVAETGLTNKGDQEKYTVYLLFPKKSSAYDTAANKILSVFYDKQIAADFYFINFGGDNNLGYIALEEAKDTKADLIFSMGSSSTKFVSIAYRGGAIPVVSVCSKDPVILGHLNDYINGSNSNLAFTSLDVSIELQIEYLRKLMPDLSNIVVMYAKNNSSAVATQAEPLKKISASLGIRTIDAVVHDQGNARAELDLIMPDIVRQIKGYDPEFKETIFWITGSTSVFREIETINKHSSTIPVLSVTPDVVVEGENSAVLSIGVSFESNAHIAALYAADIITGSKEPGDLPVGMASSPDIAINFLKARKIGLKIPFTFFESATIVYDGTGKKVRENGQIIKE
jgi:putative tryptophan/tyrosine transport system substrate-binding protein